MPARRKIILCPLTHQDYITENFTSDPRIAKMSENILKRLKKIERVEVWFDVEHDINTFDKILGRRAHI